MSNELFILGATFILGALLTWGFCVLPQEQWQFLAAIPGKRREDGSWHGVNLTYYGFFNALAHMTALSFLSILAGSIGVSLDKELSLMIVMLGVCLPSSRLLARWIEKKPYTFTVGGASFIGILLAPAAVWMVYRGIYAQYIIPYLPLLAAMSIAYAVGEGVGRLACISFGCCYGRPICFSNTLWDALFRRCAFVFTGEMKKVAYEGGMNDREIFPIQAITATIFTSSALVGMYLFLCGLYGAALVFTVIVTQLWRVLSELFRADHRGNSSWSIYQSMALLTLPYVLAMWLLLPSNGTVANIQEGIKSFWQPEVILFIQFWGAGIFWFTGYSRVTGAQISFHLHNDLI